MYRKHLAFCLYFCMLSMPRSRMDVGRILKTFRRSVLTVACISTLAVGAYGVRKSLNTVSNSLIAVS